MATTRLVVVGGGSQFSIGLCESLVDYGRDALAGTEVVLLDVDPDHLGMVHRFGSRLAEAAGVDMRFSATTDRREAFEGADFILTTFRPGTHAQLIEDETVPPKHGLQGNETVGIGGIFMACRVAPVLAEMCADAEELCPDAWIVNYTNPTQHVAETVRQVSSLKVISLCDGFIDVVEDLAYLLGVPEESIRIQVAGTNHAIWVMRFTVDGADGYELLRRRMRELDRDELERMYAPPETVHLFDLDFSYEQMYKQFIPHLGFRFSLQLYELYGLVPGPRYYWRYLLDQDAIVEAQRAGTYVSMGGFYTEHLEPRLFSDLEARLERASGELRLPRRAGGASHGDLAVRVIASMLDDTGEDFVVNVPNEGAIANLPAGAIVEVTARVGRQGPVPYAVGALPESLVGLQQALVRSQQLAVKAALSGSRDELLQAIVAHPLVNSVDAAEACMDELLALQARWLPQFASAHLLAGREA
jgi:6-phospho-beta-glucosidase